MNRKVLLMADSTCDLSAELKERYKVQTYPLHIVLSGKSYDDSVDIMPDQIYEHFYQTGELPKTSAVNMDEYANFFRPFIAQGYDIVHINIGSALSTSHQNCLAAARELGHVFPVDSCNLSTGTGLLVIEAAQCIEKGMSAAQTAEYVRSVAAKSHASFIMDRLDFMRAGGRCSTITMLGANLLNLKPCIEVDNQNGGSMGVGKKYRGKLEKVLQSYVEDKLAQYTHIKKDHIFITHSGISEEREQWCGHFWKASNILKKFLLQGQAARSLPTAGPIRWEFYL